MIDFHTHILPGVDDGSTCVEESFAMLRLSARQGVRQIVATPHFYANRETPENFLRRRDAAWHKLKEQLPSGTPDVHLGAEVYYFRGISRMEQLPQLCFGNGNVLLLEMPFKRWSESMVEEIIILAQEWDMTIMLAHIDRYLNDQPNQTWARLEQENVLFQVNASALLGNWFQRRKILNLIKNDKIAAIGSDCHNMHTEALIWERLVRSLKKSWEALLQRN